MSHSDSQEFEQFLRTYGMMLSNDQQNSFSGTSSSTNGPDTSDGYNSGGFEAPVQSNVSETGIFEEPSNSTGSAATGFEPNVIEMMENNITMIRMFQENTMGANRSAFRLSAAICIVALFVLGGILVLTALKLIEPNVAFVTGVAGAIAELASGISLVLHQRVSAQISRFFDAMHENERELYAMHLIMQITDDNKRDDALYNVAVNLASEAVGATSDPSD